MVPDLVQRHEVRELGPQARGLEPSLAQCALSVQPADVPLSPLQTVLARELLDVIVESLDVLGSRSGSANGFSGSSCP